MKNINNKNIILGLFLSGALLLGGCQSEPEEVVIERPDMTTTDAEVEEPTETEIDQSNLTLKTVEIKGMAFHPQELVIHPGDTVVWVNNDMFTHDVTKAETLEWTSNPIEIGQVWQMIPEEGFSYICSIHPNMTGTIIIEENQ